METANYLYNPFKIELKSLNFWGKRIENVGTSGGSFSSRGESLWWIVVSSPKITFPRPIKENYISLVVSEILRYGQTNIQTDILLHIIVPGDISGFVDNLTSRLRDISTKLFVLISVL